MTALKRVRQLRMRVDVARRQFKHALIGGDPLSCVASFEGALRGQPHLFRVLRHTHCLNQAVAI
jgi:hypothetical protein